MLEDQTLTYYRWAAGVDSVEEYTATRCERVSRVLSKSAWHGRPVKGDDDALGVFHLGDAIEVSECKDGARCPSPLTVDSNASSRVPNNTNTLPYHTTDSDYVRGLTNRVQLVSPRC